MNVILVTHLETVRNCDAKNLSAIIDEYSLYTELEELFHQAIVERSLKTGYEDPSRYVDEDRIIDFFRNPWNYRGVHTLRYLLEHFLREWYFPVYPDKPECKLTILNEIFSSNLKDYTYDSFIECFNDDDEQSLKNYNTSRHLEWLSMNYVSEYERVLKEHTKLTDLEIEMLLGILEERQYSF